MSDKLKNYVSNDGTYLIPVEWSVYSTINVEADNLEEAIEKAKAAIDDLPISTDCEYIDGSYKINADDDDELIFAQSCYRHISDVRIRKDGSITS